MAKAMAKAVEKPAANKTSVAVLTNSKDVGELLARIEQFGRDASKGSMAAVNAGKDLQDTFRKHSDWTAEFKADLVEKATVAYCKTSGTTDKRAIDSARSFFNGFVKPGAMEHGPAAYKELAALKALSSKTHYTNAFQQYRKLNAALNDSKKPLKTISEASIKKTVKRGTKGKAKATPEEMAATARNDMVDAVKALRDAKFTGLTEAQVEAVKAVIAQFVTK